MSTKSKATGTSAKMPRASFILCEQVRPEPNGKLTLLGVFTGEEVGVLSTKTDALPPGAVAVLNDLAIVATFFDGSSGEASFRIISPTGKTVLEGRLGRADFAKGHSATLIVATRPFFVGSFGVYRCTFRVGRTEHNFRFSIVDRRPKHSVPPAP